MTDIDLTQLSINPEALQAVVNEIESLEADKKAVSRSIKQIYDEAKETGFDTKAIRNVVRLRKKSRDEREQEETVLTTYLQALGEV